MRGSAKDQQASQPVHATAGHGRPGTLAEVVLDLVLRPMLPIRNGKLHLFPKPRLPESQAALPLLSESVTGVSTVAGRGEEDF